MSELVYFVKNGFGRGVKDAMTLRPIRDVVRQAVMVASSRRSSEIRTAVRQPKEGVNGETTIKKAN